MRTIAFIIILILAPAIQISAFPAIFPSFLIPSLVLASVISITLIWPQREAVIFAFISGLALDIFSDQPFGLFLVSYLLVALVVSLLSKQIIGNLRWYSVFAIGIIASLMVNAIIIGFAALSSLLTLSSFPEINYLSFAFEPLANGVLAAIIFYILFLLARRFKIVAVESHELV